MIAARMRERGRVPKALEISRDVRERGEEEEGEEREWRMEAMEVWMASHPLFARPH